MSSNHLHQQQQSPIKNNETLAYLCYRCKKPGHFMNNCPENTPKRSPISHSSSSTTSDPEFSSHYCHCGAGLCSIAVSGSSRKYYRCPGKYGKNCGYFKWCDELKEDGIRKSQPESSFPECKCRAGVCSIRVEQSGPNAERKYFACPIKKGDGACNFRQWLDESPHSVLISSEDVASEDNNLLDDEFELSYEEAMQIDAIEMSAHGQPSEHLLMQIECSGGAKRSERDEEALKNSVPFLAEGSGGNKMNDEAEKNWAPEMCSFESSLEQVQIQMEDSDKADEPLTEIHPHPVQNNTSQNNLDSEILTQNIKDDDSVKENTQASVTTVVTALQDAISRAKCPDPKIDMLLHLLKACIFQETGSPGHIAETPQRVAISPRSTVINGTFPNFDQVTRTKDSVSSRSVLLEDSFEEGFETSPTLNDHPSGLLLNPSGILKDGLNEGSRMSGTILRAFGKLAHEIQENLIVLLECIDPLDHEIMLKEADCTFAALDCLQVNYELFHTRVTEYINQAKSLALVEQAINEKTSSEEILNRYDNEKSHLMKFGMLFVSLMIAIWLLLRS